MRGRFRLLTIFNWTESMPWLLDTNVLIAVTKANPAVRYRLGQHLDHDILLSSIVLAEIEYGIPKSAKREHNRQVFEEISRTFKLVSFGSRASRHCGEIRASIEKQGTPIGQNDLFIAAEALAQDAILVTDNIREFSRVEGLRLENWLR